MRPSSLESRYLVRRHEAYLDVIWKPQLASSCLSSCIPLHGLLSAWNECVPGLFCHLFFRAGLIVRVNQLRALVLLLLHLLLVLAGCCFGLFCFSFCHCGFLIYTVGPACNKMVRRAIKFWGVGWGCNCRIRWIRVGSDRRSTRLFMWLIKSRWGTGKLPLVHLLHLLGIHWWSTKGWSLG